MGNGDAQVMGTAAPTNLRRAERRETLAASTLRTEGMRPIDVTVLDFSTTGFRIESAEELSVSSEISIGLPGVGTRPAFIAWRQGDRYGCAFHAPIAQADADRAFATASGVIAMGRRQQAVVKKSGPIDLMADHKHWHLPLDAMLAIAGYAATALYGLWYFLR